MLVHVADGGVGVCHFRDLAQELACVPFNNFACLPFLVVGCWLMVELTVEGVAVGGVGHKRRAVGGCAGGGDEAGAGQCFCGSGKKCY
jgi:hypothetical protein